MNQSTLLRKLASNDLKNLKKADPDKLFAQRFSANMALIKELYFSLYPNPKKYHFFEELNSLLPKLYKQRSEELKQHDIQLLKKGNWYQSEKMVGMQLYVDLFNKDLKGLEQKIPYFEELGINFLHLMPLTTRPKGENDGGYAVNSYTAVDPKFGTKKDLLSLTKKLRERGIYLMLDFVVNHTSDEYPWAKKALKGQEEYQDYYYMYPDRVFPDAFEASLPQVFPDTSPGNFTYKKEIDKWVMTVFNSYQWDLNYTNPKVFLEMLTNLVKMVNAGVDVVRFDALAFLWKKIGTSSQNLPEAHLLISLFRMCLQVVAPGVIFLAEAIVAPKEIVKYFGEGKWAGNECDMAYNASLMALLWNSIATKKSTLLYKSLINSLQKPEDTTWINYLRCHDDIGLGLEDQYIEELGWSPWHHRKFLLDYFYQNLDWSPAVGYPFMYNKETGDGRITGSCASLLGLEKAIRMQDDAAIEIAIKKILMLHGIILSYGGIPLIYAGDEIGTLNDYSYLENEHKKIDSRWVNRPAHDWEAVTRTKDPKTIASRIFYGIKHMIALRKKIKAFADQSNLELHDSQNPHLFLFERKAKKDKGVLILVNFDEQKQLINSEIFRSLGYLKEGSITNLINGEEKIIKSAILDIEPFEIMWLAKA